MIRRVFGLLGGGAALLTFASCATFETDNAATVNGHDISVDQLDDIRDHIASSGEQFATAADIDAGGEAKGDLTRAVLQVLISNDVARAVLADAGGAVTDAQLADALAALGGDSVPAGPALDALVQRQALTAAVDALPAPDAATLQARYEARPISTGVLCVLGVSGPTKADVDAAVQRLREGQPATGDGVETASTCRPAEQILTGLPDEEQDLLLDGRPGTVTDLIDSSLTNGTAGWSVLQLQPWADAEAELTALYAGTTSAAPAADGSTPPSAGQLTLTGALFQAKITINSTYGRWDPLSGGVVALTPAPEGATAGAA